MSQPKAVIFDLDGVLVDSSHFHFQAWQRWACEVGLERPLTVEWFRRTFGQRNDSIISRLFDHPLVPDQILALSDRKEAIFRELARGRIDPLPGACELVIALRQQGFRLAVGTSTPPANLEMVLDSLGLAHCFPVRITSVDVQQGKPDPEVFLRAAERLQVPPSRCVVIEDAEVGVEAARRAGMRCLAVASSRTADRLTGADQVVGSLADVTPASIERLLGMEASQ